MEVPEKVFLYGSGPLAPSCGKTVYDFFRTVNS